jgi:hypothetical protein
MNLVADMCWCGVICAGEWQGAGNHRKKIIIITEAELALGWGRHAGYVKGEGRGGGGEKKRGKKKKRGGLGTAHLKIHSYISRTALLDETHFQWREPCTLQK